MSGSLHNGTENLTANKCIDTGRPPYALRGAACWSCTRRWEDTMEAHRKVVTVWVVKACALLCVLAATLGAVACGTSDSAADGNSAVAASPAAPASPSPVTKTYSNTEFDFAFDYDPAVIDGPENVTRPVPDTPGLLAMQFPGEGGGGGLALMVQEFDRRLEKADGAQYKDRLQSDMDALVDHLDPDGVATPLADVETNGAWGFVTTLSFTRSATEYRMREYVLFRDTFQYKLSLSTSDAEWAAAEPCFDLVIDTFRPAE